MQRAARSAGQCLQCQRTAVALQNAGMASRARFSTGAIAYLPRRKPFERTPIPVDAVPEDPPTLAKPTDWYIDEDFVASRLRDLPSTKKERTEPPAHMPAHLQRFMTDLQESPFFAEVKVIDAKTISSGTHYTDWVFIAILKEGRQRSIRGATMRTRDELEDLLASAGTDSNVLVEGHDTEAAVWTLLDAAPSLIVHVMTPQAHGTWNLEDIWLKAERAPVMEEQ